jgi:hypothetical protein
MPSSNSATQHRIRRREYSGKPAKPRAKQRPKLEACVRKARQDQAKEKTAAFNTDLDGFMLTAKEAITDIAVNHGRTYEHVARRVGFSFAKQHAARKPSAWDGFCASKSMELQLIARDLAVTVSARNPHLHNS